MDQHFGKHERLKSRKLIQELFNSGKSVKAFPLIALYMPVDDPEYIQAGFSVSKKRLKKAVDRNTVKRRLREAYRLNRHDFDLLESGGMALMFIYIKNGLSDYSSLEKSMQKVLSKMVERKG